ncbi:U1 small nuclear ribonucleoprotein 70 kDa [Daktulosphaira vitifoliae]|uniref:U1 small nuclear ribonucleoprotein 70 kDa n=1 Tax=Daktulosphaira vitifoliae TaxID=58002 RepID=UPI0021A9BCC6|nr:U1 small nuclear ribonucleoprotein 70 kDa [Daktulosphaira vitifoliae]
MTQFLPPNLLALFAPRDPIPYLPPVVKLPYEKKTRGYLGVGSFIDLFEEPEETPPPTKIETREERLERRRREKAEQVAYKLEQEIALWEPHSVPNATTDPFKTLFVARINYDTSESKLRREFELYGPIKKIVVIHNKIDGKPRGYAFIEYEYERDMHSAYKHADGKKIDGRRVLVDVERARTVKGWLPRRLGGGLGGTRRGGPEVNLKHSGREDNERERERYAREMASGRSGRSVTMERDRERDYRDRDRDRERDRRPRSRDRERKRHHTKSRSRERKRRRSRDRVRDVDYDEVEEVPVSKSRDKDRDRERKRKRSRSRDRERKKDRKDREHHRREKSKDRRDKHKDDSEREEKVHIKQEPVDEYDNYENYNDYDGYNSANEEYDPDMVKKEEPDEEPANGSRYNSSSFYNTKPERGEENYSENGQTENYDE